jgi:hypothetical protein
MKSEKNDILTILFWTNFAVYVMHLLDETLMAGGFVSFVQRHFWAGFKITDFFHANTIWLIVIALSNILYDLLGNRFKFIAAIPMIFVWERFFNALSHMFLTFYCNEYCPGLVTSLLCYIILYFICRFVVLRGQMQWVIFFISGIPALIFETIFVSSMWWAH